MQVQGVQPRAYLAFELIFQGEVDKPDAGINQSINEADNVEAGLILR